MYIFAFRYSLNYSLHNQEHKLKSKMLINLLRRLGILSGFGRVEKYQVQTIAVKLQAWVYLWRLGGDQPYKWIWSFNIQRDGRERSL